MEMKRVKTLTEQRAESLNSLALFPWLRTWRFETRIDNVQTLDFPIFMVSRVKSPEKFIFSGFRSIRDHYSSEKPGKPLKIPHFWALI